MVPPYVNSQIIRWPDKVQNNDVLLKSWCPIHVHTPTSTPPTLAGPHSQEDGCIPRIYSTVSLPVGLGVKATPNYASTMYASMTWEHATFDTKSWEAFADDRTLWKQHVSQGLKRGEAAIQEKNDEGWARRIASHQQDHQDQHQTSFFTCQGCSRDCKSRIGIYSHTRWCSSTTSHGATP